MEHGRLLSIACLPTILGRYATCRSAGYYVRRGFSSFKSRVSTHRQGLTSNSELFSDANLVVDYVGRLTPADYIYGLFTGARSLTVSRAMSSKRRKINQ